MLLCLVIGILCVILIAGIAVWWAAPNSIQSVSMLAGKASDDRGRPPNMADVKRPPDQKNFNQLNPKKMYAAANVVPGEGAGYQLNDCAFKNITANSKNDPILEVAKMFPGVSAHENMMQTIDAQTFPVSSTYPLALRQTALSSVDARAGIAATNLKALMSKSGRRGNLRNDQGIWFGASANVSTQVAKQPAIFGSMMGASDAWYSAAAQGMGLNNQKV